MVKIRNGEEQKMVKSRKWGRQKNSALSRLIDHSIGTRRRLMAKNRDGEEKQTPVVSM